MPPSYKSVQAKVDEIETEMKRIGMWQKEPPPPENLDFKKAFGMDKFALEQWLQFVFLPRVRDIIATKGTFPTQSQVSAQAYREWKMWGSDDDKDQLIERLREFDALFS